MDKKAVRKEGKGREGTDAFATRACRQVGHIDRFSLPFGAVVNDRENHKILRTDICGTTFVRNGQRASAGVTASIGL
jgi:hypothetical protein